MAVAVAREVRQYDWMRSFIERYPGTSSDYVPDVTDGFPWWLRWQHFFNTANGVPTYVNSTSAGGISAIPGFSGVVLIMTPGAPTQEVTLLDLNNESCN